MKLYIVRHGQTNYNVQGLTTSRPGKHVFLTDQGTAQAKRVAEQLKNTSIDLIYVSELYRTQQTAEYINQYHNASTKIDARLNDIRTGYEDGACKDYDDEKYSSPDPFTFCHGDGESSEDVLARIRLFLTDLKQETLQNILIVGSEHPLLHLVGLLDGIDPRKAIQNKIQNCEIIIRSFS